MKTLFIDTSGPQSELVLLTDQGSDQGDSRFRQKLNSDQNFTAAILPALSELLLAAAVEIHQLDQIAVFEGPGAFTALRVGAATALGLSSSRTPSIPVLGIWPLAQPFINELIAARVKQTDSFLAFCTNNREYVAALHYHRGHCQYYDFLPQQQLLKLAQTVDSVHFQTSTVDLQFQQELIAQLKTGKNQFFQDWSGERSFLLNYLAAQPQPASQAAPAEMPLPALKLRYIRKSAAEERREGISR